MPAEDALGLIVEAESHRRIRLELFAFVEAVKVNACYGGHFGLVVGLALDYRGQNRSLHRSEALGTCTGDIVVGPEGVIGLLLAAEDIFHGISPVNLVCVGDYQGEDFGGTEAKGGQKGRILEGFSSSKGVRHHLGGYPFGYGAYAAHRTGKHQIDRGLPSEGHHPGGIGARAGGVDGVMAGLYGSHRSECPPDAPRPLGR